MINCKLYADEILSSIRGYGGLVVISVGSDPASESYIRGKKKDCNRVGFTFTHHAFPYGTPVSAIVHAILAANEDPKVTGIIVQLPLPKGYDEDAILSCIKPEKDVDGFHKYSPFKPCTPEGIVYLLKKEMGSLTGKHAVLIGRGKLVGKPIQQMLLDEDMTISVCHSKTPVETIDRLASNADAVIVAVGKPRAIDLWELLPWCVVVDCGINRDEKGILCGDVDFTSTGNCTPVPGGVGLLTRAMLMKHLEREIDT